MTDNPFKIWRHSRAMTQKQAAHAAGVTARTVRLWEASDALPTRARAFLLVDGPLARRAAPPRPAPPRET